MARESRVISLNRHHGAMRPWIYCFYRGVIVRKQKDSIPTDREMSCLRHGITHDSAIPYPASRVEQGVARRAWHAGMRQGLKFRRFET